MSDYITFKFWSAVAIVSVVFFAVFFYGLFTGKDLREKFRERPRDKNL